MKEFIDKLIERLEKQAEQYRNRGFEYEKHGYSATSDKYYAKQCSYLHSIEIVNQLAEEYKVSEMPTGWIPCSERLPEEFKSVIITAIAMNGAYYTEIGKWNGNQWFHGASNTRIDMAEVIAWQPLPAPYTEGE